MVINNRRNTLGNHILKYLPFIAIPFYLGLILGKHMPISKFLEDVNNLDITWLIPSFDLTSIKLGLIFSMIYILILLKTYEPGNIRSDAFGSAKWGDPRSLRKFRHIENPDYLAALKPKELKMRLLPRTSEKAIPDLKPVRSNNRILSNNVRFDIDVKTAETGNVNTIVIGSPGSWKTTSIVYSNIMQLTGSMVICDPKGEATLNCAPLGIAAGFDVKVLDLQNMDHSIRFNPFEYIRDDEDIPRMVSFVFRGMDVEKNTSGSKDPFWDDANMLEMTAIAYLLYYDARPEDQNLPMIIKLVNLNSIMLKRRVGNQVKEISGLSKLFEDYARRFGEDNMPMTYYRLFNKAKDKTLANMETTLVAKMQSLMQPKVMRLLSKDDLKLREVGKRETLLFLKVPDTDNSYNFIVSLVYMFLYKELYDLADIERKGHGCDVPVTFFCDEFSSFPQPSNFVNLMSTCRSRNISIMPIFQAIPQLKAMKIFDSNTFSSLFGQADSLVFLGSQEPETCKFISERLGKETVDYITSSKQGYSRNKTGRDLMTPNEVAELPKKKCIIMISGKKPVIDDKFYFLKHPNLMLTAIPRDGSGQEPYDPTTIIEELKVNPIDDIPIVMPELLTPVQPEPVPVTEEADTKPKIMIFFGDIFKKIKSLIGKERFHA